MQADFSIKSANDFSSIKEYNQYIEQAKNFTKRTANRFDLVNPETGTHISYKTLNKVEKEIKRINTIKDKAFQHLKDLPHKEMGRSTGLTIGQAANPITGFSDPKFENFKHVHFHPKDLAGEKDAKLQLNKLKENYQGDFITRREQQHFLNYIASIHTAFNQSSHPLTVVLDDEIWSVIDSIIDKGLDEFNRLYYQGMLPTIDFIYGKDTREQKIEELKTAFLGE
jgi:hypothetical protein